MKGGFRPSRVAGWMGLTSGDAATAQLARMLGCAENDPHLHTRSGDDWAVAVHRGVDAIAVEQVLGHEVVLFADAASSDTATRLDAATAVVRSVTQHGAAGLGPGQADTMALVLDPRRGSLLAGFDRFSNFPICTARTRRGVVFASCPSGVVRHEAVGAELDLQAVYDYLYATVVPSPRTVFRAVRMLPPGHVLHFSPDGLEEIQIWEPTFHVDSNSQDRDLRREVLGLLERSVERCSAGAEGEVGCFLSGGIDSSTVAGLLSSRSDSPVKAFSIGFDAEGYNELEYARVVARHFGLEHHEYYVTPQDIVNLIPTIGDAYGQPFGNSSVIPTLHCAQIAREHGVTRMLAGDGGDELFGGNERYASQYLFSLYDSSPRVARQLLTLMFGGSASLLRGVPVVKKLCSYVRQAAVPLPDRLDNYNYLNQLGNERVLNADFLAEVDDDQVLNHKRCLYQGPAGESWLNGLLALDYKITLADNDLPKVNVMSNLGGVAVRFPFLDSDLVEFAGRLSPQQKVRRTRLRAFFKSAVAGVLPPQVLSKSKHGFGLPFGVWTTTDTRLRECVFGLLDGARHRAIVNPAFIDELRSTLLDTNPRYYGPLVWTIIMLEQWLQSHHTTEA